MGNTCGTHVVANAWAHILGLELNDMDDWVEDESLYREARFLMIRAAAGDVSAQDIEAWLVGSQKVWERKHEPAVGSELAAILGAQTVAMEGNILSEFIENANMEVAATPSAEISHPVSTAPPTTTNTSATTPPINKPTTAATPVINTSNRPDPTQKLPWSVSGYVIDTSDEEDSSSKSQDGSTDNVSKIPTTKPALKPTPKPAAKAATKASTAKSTAAKTSLPKASGQPGLRRSGRTRQTVSKAPGFVSSLEIPQAEAEVLPAKRKAADLDSESFDDSDIESSHYSQNSDDESLADSSKGSDDNGGNYDDAANIVRPGVISAAAKDPQRNSQWTIELRYQAFGLLDFAEMRQLAIRVGVDKSRLRYVDKSPIGWKALAYSDIAVPSHVADLEAVTKMRYESGHLESTSTGPLCLEVKPLYTQLPMKHTYKTHRDLYIQRLKEYTQGTAPMRSHKVKAPKPARIQRKGEESAEHKRLKARATQLKTPTRCTQRSEEREQERLALNVDDRLPRIQVTRRFKLVLLVFRYSDKPTVTRLAKNESYLQTVEEALRHGRILANLEDAEYVHIILERQTARTEMPPKGQAWIPRRFVTSKSIRRDKESFMSTPSTVIRWIVCRIAIPS
ncbi:MAG: hypothetical protein Q9171_007467 [Xanthocarpia ochracea]